MIALAARTASSPVLGRATRSSPCRLRSPPWRPQGSPGRSRRIPLSLAPVGAVATAVVAVRCTGSTYAALAAGMPALWILSAVLA